MSYESSDNILYTKMLNTNGFVKFRVLISVSYEQLHVKEEFIWNSEYKF